MSFRPPGNLTDNEHHIMKHSKTTIPAITWAFLLILLPALLKSQTPFLDSTYAVRPAETVVYGEAMNYKACMDTLRMDLYKPAGDGNTARPTIVIVHGGAWVSGSRTESSIVNRAKEFASRGYVAATVDYRLGFHLANYVALAPVPETGSCLYAADTAEVLRANYRAMQDVKGAIRFLKSRFATDSVDINKVFILGESAGAFTSLAVAYLDDPSEKHPACGTLSPAPTPDPDLVCNLNSCTVNSFTRNDLGSIDGTLHTGTYNSKVCGVASMYGAMFGNYFPVGSGGPILYVYHQTCDAVVPWYSGEVEGGISACLYYCTGYNSYFGYMPKLANASGIIPTLPGVSTAAPQLHSHIVNNGLPPAPCFECAAAILIPDYYLNFCHSVLDLPTEADSVAAFFYDCVTGKTANPDAGISFRIWPNPASQEVMIETDAGKMAETVELIDTKGHSWTLFVQDEGEGRTKIALPAVSPGMYLIRASIGESHVSARIVVIDKE